MKDIDVHALREEARHRSRQRAKSVFAGLIVDATVSGIPVRRYFPQKQSCDAVIYFLHGGYGILGDLDLQDNYCRSLATAMQWRVVSLDYPLAPEHTFGESAAAVATVIEDEEANRVVLSGDSAGGAVAMAAAHHLGIPAVAGLLLTNPNLDLTLSSIDRNAPGGPDIDLMTRSFRAWCRGQSPRLRFDHDVGGLPPTFIAVGTSDSLAPECRRLYVSLRSNGIRASLVELEAAPHGLVSDPKLAERVVDGARDFFVSTPS